MTDTRNRGNVFAKSMAVGMAALMTATSSAALAQDQVEITFWTWLPDIQKTVDLFEASHPNISVNVENVGVGTDQYTKMQNAIDAGSGGPDVAHMTYDAIPNFVLIEALADVTQYGADDVRDVFLPGVLGLTEFNGGVYGIPQDFGPGVMYYRPESFESVGLDVPRTWADMAAAGEVIHADNPENYVTFLAPGLVDAAYMGLWQLDAQPWSVEGGTNVTLNLQSEKALQWANYWDALNQEGLVVHSEMGSDEWFRQLGNGQIATWVVGAWGLQALTGVLADNAGEWRVAPQPVWNEGDTATSHFGGSANVVLAQSDKKEAAVTFAMWINGSVEGVESLKNDQGLLPTTNAAWEDPDFTDEEIEYLGGQQARQIFAQSAVDSVVGWEWLPFQPYVSSVFGDTVGQAIANETSIADGLAAWQDRIAEYAEAQGFSVTVE